MNAFDSQMTYALDRHSRLHGEAHMARLATLTRPRTAKRAGSLRRVVAVIGEGFIAVGTRLKLPEDSAAPHPVKQRV